MSERTDRERLDWIEAWTWITLEKTDESDNNGIGLVDSAVTLESNDPDGSRFGMVFAATFRAAIDAAMDQQEKPDA